MLFFVDNVAIIFVIMALIAIVLGIAIKCVRNVKHKYNKKRCGIAHLEIEDVGLENVELESVGIEGKSFDDEDIYEIIEEKDIIMVDSYKKDTNDEEV